MPVGSPEIDYNLFFHATGSPPIVRTGVLLYLDGVLLSDMSGCSLAGLSVINSTLLPADPITVTLPDSINAQLMNISLGVPPDVTFGDTFSSGCIVVGNYRSILRQNMTFFLDLLSVGGGYYAIPNEFGTILTILTVKLICLTPPIGSDLIFDIHDQNNVTIFTDQSHRPRVMDGNITGETVNIDRPFWPDGEYLLAYIDQLGSYTAGENVTLVIVVEGELM